MNGKQHATIGATIGMASTYVYLGGNFSPNNITTVAVPVIIGSLLGSWMPDIDSKKSKASQAFNKVILSGMVLLVGGHYLDLDVLNRFIDFGKSTITTNIALMVFLANIILGHLSSHRQYTHRWLGTLVFCASAYLAFNKIVAIGFIIGYISHILADRTTAAGKNLHFFRFQLPMVNSKGQFHISI